MDQNPLALKPQPSATENAAAPSARTTSLSPSCVVDDQPPDERLLTSLTWLRLLVIRRNEDPLNDAAQNLAYIELLFEYPIDVALEVIRQWPRRNKFWPAWCELQEAIEAAMASDEPPPADDPISRLRDGGHALSWCEDVGKAYEAAWTEARLPALPEKIRQRMKYSVVKTLIVERAEQFGIDGGPFWSREECLRRVPATG